MATADALVVIPPPTDDDKPFKIEDELTIYEAAMVYAGRHPYPQFFGLRNTSDKRRRCLALLRLGLSEASLKRRRAQRSHDIYCELVERIERGTLQPVKFAYDHTGEMDPIRTTIRTSDLASLATKRRERPRYLRHLQVDQKSSEPTQPTKAEERHSPLAQAKSREAVIAKKLGDGAHPGRDVPWKQFYDDVRHEADGWINLRDRNYKRGFSDKSICRAVSKLINGTNRTNRGVP